MTKIGFIGGGNMAEAMALGLLKDTNNTFEIFISEPNQERQTYLQDTVKEINILNSTSELLKQDLGEVVENYNERNELRLNKEATGVVETVIINGKLAMDNSEFVSTFGTQKFGEVIRLNQWD